MKRVSIIALMVIIAICAWFAIRQLGVTHSPDPAQDAGGPPTPQTDRRNVALVLHEVEYEQANSLFLKWNYPGAVDGVEDQAILRAVRKETSSATDRDCFLVTGDKPERVWRYYDAKFGIKSAPRTVESSDAGSMEASFGEMAGAGYITVELSHQPGQRFTQIVLIVRPRAGMDPASGISSPPHIGWTPFLK